MPHAVGPCPVPPKSPKTRAGKDNFLPQNEQHLVRLLAKSVAHERANQGPPQSGWKCVPAPPKPRSTQTNCAWKKHCQRHNNLSKSRATSLRVGQPLLETLNLFRSRATSLIHTISNEIMQSKLTSTPTPAHSIT